MIGYKYGGDNSLGVRVHEGSMTQLASAVTYTRCLYPALALDPTRYRLRPPIGGKLYSRVGNLTIASRGGRKT